MTLLTWSHLGAVLTAAMQSVQRADERGYGERALAWMLAKGLMARGV